MKQNVWLFLIFVFVTAPSYAAEPQCTRTVLVSFYDQPTKVEIETLRTEDFEIKINGKKFPVLNSSRDFNNRLLILLETQGAAKNSHLDDLVSTVILQARQAPAGKPVAFGIFGEKTVFTKDFVSDPDKRTAAFAGIMEEAGTLGKRVGLWNALHEAIKVFGPHQPGDTILLVSDPYDDFSHRSAEDVEKELIASGTRLFMMRRLRASRVDNDFAWKSHDFEKMIIDRMTQETGGLWSDYVPTLINFAWAGYMLEIKVPPGMENPHKWKVQFQGSAAQVHRKTNFYFPARLPGCSTNPGDSPGTSKPATN